MWSRSHDKMVAMPIYTLEPKGQHMKLCRCGFYNLSTIVLRNNKKCENLEYYFITCMFPKINLKSGFRISCSVRRKLFEEATSTALSPNLLGILTFLGFLESGGNFKRCNSHVTTYISVLKFLQVSVKSITHFKSVIASYKSVLVFKHCHSVDSIDSIRVDPDQTDPIRSV